jgi:hypothetical protein
MTIPFNTHSVHRPPEKWRYFTFSGCGCKGTLVVAQGLPPALRCFHGYLIKVVKFDNSTKELPSSAATT